ncbi:MAG TPA: cell envelope integrity protein TolA [Candidatus Solibacter sp.]|nr:cell envelope integrity protein TolA [Candidatus Solibacter sp.]
MKKLATLTLSLFLSCGIAFADTPKDAPKDGGAQPAKPAQPAKAKPAKNAEKSDSAIAAEIEELRQAVQAQQEQLQVLKEELAKRDRQIDEARDAAAAANARAAEASTKATEAVNSTAEVKSTAATLNTTVADLKASNDVLKTTVETEAAKASKAEEEGPAAIRFKGITITPGGFLAAESVFRTRATGGGINTPFTGIPYPNNDLSKVSEFNASGRQSRLSFLFEGKADNVAVTGYYELDWLGACATSNNRQSNSYCMRQRQIWGSAALPSGWTFSGGQMWSLATERKKGLENRTEVLPMTIDPQYNVGFTWARQYSFRVTKNIGDKVAVGVSVEGPQTTVGGRGTPTPILYASAGSGGGLFNGTDSTGYSLNKTPDFIFKAAIDPGWGHYELFGVVSTFRARIYPCAVNPAVLTLPTSCVGAPGGTAADAFNSTATGGGIGVNLRAPIIKKYADAGIHFFGGDGVGRYSSAQMADVTIRPDGTLAPIKGGSALGTLELHPSPKLDVYFNYGVEYAYRTAYGYTNITTLANVPVGYGSPLFNNSGCGNSEGVPGATNSPASNGTCTGDLRNIQEGTVGFWHQLYKGSKGGIRWGLQYSYLVKNTWSGNNNTPTAPGVNGKAVDNMLLTSFRYYIP